MLLMHAAMMCAVIMYGVMAYAVAEGEPAAPPAIDHGAMLAIAGAIAAACAALSFYLRARRMPPRDAAPDSLTFDLRVLESPPGKAALVRLRTALVLSWALSEAVAIAGLAVALLFHDTRDYAPFGAVALGLLLVHAPRPRLLVQVMRALPAHAS
jgi:hypothetical protein